MSEEAIQKGVAEAMDFWLSQHDVSTPACIEAAIEKSFAAWLEAHAEEIVERIAGAGLVAATGPAIASRESVALLRLLTCASLMRLAIKERATFLTKTTDWERLEDAMRSAEKVLSDYTQSVQVGDEPPRQETL